MIPTLVLHHNSNFTVVRGTLASGSILYSMETFHMSFCFKRVASWGNLWGNSWGNKNVGQHAGHWPTVVSP